MEIKIVTAENEENQLNELVDYLRKCGLEVIRQAGGNMPNYSGYFASLKGNYSDRQISTEANKQHDSKALHIANVVRSLSLKESQLHDIKDFCSHNKLQVLSDGLIIGQYCSICKVFYNKKGVGIKCL